MFKTKLTEMLGIEFPIICGGMAYLSRAELIAAISEAGGIGVLVSSAFDTADGLRAEIRKTRELTKKPIAVNINLFSHSRPNTPNSEFAKVCGEEGVALVETSGTRSPEDLIPILHAGGVKVMHKCTTVKHAISGEKAGADLIAVVGNEGGGAVGRSEIGTLILTAKTVEILDIPVIAAGGFATGKSLVAALALGAEGVVMGTRFMAVKECPAHPDFKEALTKLQETDTIVIERNIGNEHRMARTETAMKVHELEQKGAGINELLPYISGSNAKKMYDKGSLEGGVFSCGQVVTFVNDVPSVKEVFARIAVEAKEAMSKLNNMAG